MTFFGERDNWSRVVLGISNRGLRQKALAREAFNVVLHPRPVAVIGKLAQVVHPHNAEFAYFSQRINLGISQRILLVPVCVFGPNTRGENRLDSPLAWQGRAFADLPVKAIGPVLFLPDVVTGIPRIPT